MLEEASDTTTVATGGRMTLTAAHALCPSLSAMMRADPALTAVTNPVDDTVATLGLSDDHVMARPVRALPLASLRVAVAVVVPPTTTDDCARPTAMVATGGGPVTPPPPQPNAARHSAIAVRT
jgi:hypothetical protein